MAGFFNFDSQSRSLALSKEDELDLAGCFPELTLKERITAFLVCFSLGILIDALSWGSMMGLVTGSPTRFALTYTAGSILSLAGTTFLIGFKRQLKSVFDKKRRVVSTVLLVSIAMTLVSALLLKNALLTLLFIVLQVGSFIWYVASYIPWGRTCLKGCVKKCCRCLLSD
jgi:hypothetical protein